MPLPVFEPRIICPVAQSSYAIPGIGKSPVRTADIWNEIRNWTSGLRSRNVHHYTDVCGDARMRRCKSFYGHENLGNSRSETQITLFGRDAGLPFSDHKSRLLRRRSWRSVVDIATRLQAVRPRNRGSLLGKTLKPAVSLTRPPIQWEPDALSTRVKRPRRETDHSSARSAKVKTEWSYASPPPICFYGVTSEVLGRRCYVRKEKTDAVKGQSVQ